jgi:hypothetical protein
MRADVTARAFQRAGAAARRGKVTQRQGSTQPDPEPDPEPETEPDPETDPETDPQPEPETDPDPVPDPVPSVPEAGLEPAMPFGGGF